MVTGFNFLIPVVGAGSVCGQTRPHKQHVSRKEYESCLSFRCICLRGTGRGLREWSHFMASIEVDERLVR